MLKKTSRLTTAQFDQFFKTGKRFHTDSLQLIYNPSLTFHGAVVAGKKVSKRAVDRNRWRRRVYNLLYNYNKLNNSAGVFMILLKPGITKLSFDDLKAELYEVVGRAEKSR